MCCSLIPHDTRAPHTHTRICWFVSSPFAYLFFVWVPCSASFLSISQWISFLWCGNGALSIEQKSRSKKGHWVRGREFTNLLKTTVPLPLHACRISARGHIKNHRDYRLQFTLWGLSLVRPTATIFFALNKANSSSPYIRFRCNAFSLPQRKFQRENPRGWALWCSKHGFEMTKKYCEVRVDGDDDDNANAHDVDDDDDDDDGTDGAVMNATPDRLNVSLRSTHCIHFTAFFFFSSSPLFMVRINAVTGEPGPLCICLMMMAVLLAATNQRTQKRQRARERRKMKIIRNESVLPSFVYICSLSMEQSFFRSASVHA